MMQNDTHADDCRVCQADGQAHCPHLQMHVHVQVQASACTSSAMALMQP